MKKPLKYCVLWVKCRPMVVHRMMTAMVSVKIFRHMLEMLNRPKQLSRQRNVFHQNCVRIPWMYATAWDTADLETRYWLVKSTMQFRSRWVSGGRHHLLGRASWRVWLVINIFIVQLVDLSSWSAREMCPTWPFGHLWHQGNRLLNKGHGALASQHTPHCGIESTIHPWTWSHCNRSLWCCYSDGSIVDTIKSNPFLSSIKDKNRWFIKIFCCSWNFCQQGICFFFWHRRNVFGVLGQESKYHLVYRQRFFCLQNFGTF